MKKLVSKNRNRYQDSRFNLDLSYITNRVIAMGLPGKGFYKLFRNSQDDVIEFFDTYHKSRIKIYNMCNDDFVNSKVLSLADGKIKVAYFPFMDHNPGPISKIFRLVLD